MVVGPRGLRCRARVEESVMGSRVTQIYVKVKSLQLGRKFAELGFVDGRKWCGD